MKHLPTLIMIIFLGCSIFANGQVITLSQCYQLARENYPQIHQYELILLSEQYRLNTIRKGWLPQLSIHGQANYQSDVTELPFNRQDLSSLLPGSNVPTLSKDQYRMVIQLDQTIWDGGSKRTARALTKAESKAQREQVESDLYTIRQRINELYFGCLLQEELLKQNELLQKDLQTNIKRIRSMMKNGTANQSDVDAMQVELLNAQQKAIELKAGQKAFLHMLGAFVHRELNDSISLVLPELPLSPKVSRINRPELRVLEAQHEILQTKYQQQNTRLIPQFSAFVQGGYGRPTLNMLSNDFEGFYVAGIRLSWNIGNFYTVKDIKKEIATNQKMIDRQKETFLFNTQLQLTKENTEIQKMKNLMNTDEEIIRLRSNIKKAAEVKLENGVIAVTDLVREINAEDLARQKAAMHRIQHVMSCYNRLYTTN